MRIQSLSRKVVNDYLASGGERLALLRTLLAKDSRLRELALNPLMLSIILLAYQEQGSESLARKNSSSQLTHIFTTYVQQMFRHRPLMGGYSQKQAEHWLTCLASQMFDQSQTIFRSERLQPNWFSLPILKDYKLLVRLIYGFIFGTFGAICGYVLQAPEVLLFEINPALFVLVAAVSGFLLGGMFGFVESKSDIEVIEVLKWSWRKILEKSIWQRSSDILGKGLFFGVFMGLVGSATGFAVSGSEGVFLGLLGFELGTVSGLVFWAAYDFISTGLDISEIEDRVRVNQGIRRSAKIAVQFGLIFGFVLGLALGVTLSAVMGISLGLAFGIAAGLLGGLIISLLYGGATVIKHYSLRIVLARHDYLPMKLFSFLDDMVSRGMLRRVGGGYIFIHRTLLEYFARI